MAKDLLTEKHSDFRDFCSVSPFGWRHIAICDFVRQEGVGSSGFPCQETLLTFNKTVVVYLSVLFPCQKVCQWLCKLRSVESSLMLFRPSTANIVKCGSMGQRSKNPSVILIAHVAAILVRNAALNCRWADHEIGKKHRKAVHRAQALQGGPVLSLVNPLTDRSARRPSKRSKSPSNHRSWTWKLQ